MSKVKPLPNNLFELIAEVERELKTRERVYPDWIKTGKITRDTAEHRYLCMKAILVRLKKEQAQVVGQQTRMWDVKEESGQEFPPFPSSNFPIQ